MAGKGAGVGRGRWGGVRRVTIGARPPAWGQWSECQCRARALVWPWWRAGAGRGQGGVAARARRSSSCGNQRSEKRARKKKTHTMIYGPRVSAVQPFSTQHH